MNQEFAEAIRILEENYYTDGELALWLQSPQPLIDGKTPLELLAAGRKAELLQTLRQMDDGVYV